MNPNHCSIVLGSEVNIFKAFIDQGTTDAMAPWLDERIEEDLVINGNLKYPEAGDFGLPGFTRRRRSMNAADFRERCVSYGSKLFVLYEKRKPDLEPRWYMKSEELVKRLDIEFDLATQVIEVIKLMHRSVDNKLDRVDAKIIQKLIYGYTMENGDVRGGLISLKGDSSAIESTIEMIREMLEEADTDHEPLGMAWLPLRSDDYFDERMIYLVDENDEEIEDDDMDQAGDNNPYAAFPLSDGRDGVKYEFIDYIKSADVKTIKEIQKLYFKTSNAYSGKVYPAKLGHLTQTQKSICWGFINDRKKKLVKEGLAALTKKGRAVLNMVRQMKKGPQSRGLIMAWANAGHFDLGGVDVYFQRKPSQTEIFAMWAEYRSL